MSHRYRSHCCCGVTGDIERPFDCSLGWGTPPKQSFKPTKDNCPNGYSDSGIYDNSMGKNPWDNWGFCSHTRDQDLIVSIERDILLDDRTDGAYQIPIDCDFPGGTDAYCRDIENTGIPVLEYTTRNTPENAKKPLYARYTRLKKNGSLKYDTIPGDISRLDYSESWSGLTERPYAWAYNLVGPAWEPNDRTLNGLNSGSYSYPLPFNPNANEKSPDPPRDYYHPHGTLNPSNCTRTTGNGYCTDCVCSTTANYCSYNNPYWCSDTHMGAGINPFNIPLTDSQAQLIGSNWNTNDYGYVPTYGYASGRSCVSNPDACDNSPYRNRVNEFGGRYFGLQGISDHNTNYTTEDGYIKKYRLFIPYQYDIVQLYDGSGCTDPETNLWELAQTMVGFFHRETWWQLQWSGFTEVGYKGLGVNHDLPGDVFTAPNGNTYNDYFYSKGAQKISQDRLPSLVGFGCAGIPVFSWELANLYFDPEGTDSYHATTFGATNIQWGYGHEDFWLGNIINSPSDYNIPAKPINTMINLATNSADTLAVNALGRALEIANSPNATAAQIALQHRIVFCFCTGYNTDLPVEMMDLWEDVDILPEVRNYGKERDYKIFKKKLVYSTNEDTPEEEEETACCINIGEFPTGNAGVPVGQYTDENTNDIYNSNTRMGLAGPNAEWVWQMRLNAGEDLPDVPPDGFAYAFPICNEFPGYCSPTGCINPECEAAICSGDGFPCGIGCDFPNNDCGWTDAVVQIASDSDACISSTTCINTTPSKCIYWAGGTPVDGVTCPSDSKNIFDVENEEFCEDNVDEGSCCLFCEQSGPGGQTEKDFKECSVTTAQGCQDIQNSYDCGFSSTKTVWTRYLNCEGDAQACSVDGISFGSWEPEKIPGGPICNITTTVEDFYFYGKQGGWAAQPQQEPPPAILAPTFYNLVGNTNNLWRSWNYFNAIPYPMLVENIDSNPAAEDPDFRADCCPCGLDQSPGDVTWCDTPLRVSCVDERLDTPDLYVFGNLSESYGDNLVSVFPIECANQSATVTCRGMWWQFQKYDFEIVNPETFGGGARNIGCDTLNNAFFLVQEPYPDGLRYTLGITVDVDGATLGTVDGISEQELTVVRGMNNKLDATELLDDDTFDQFKGSWGISGSEYYFEDCGPEGTTGTFVSTGFKLIVRGDNPANDPDPFTQEINSEYLYNVGTRFYYLVENGSDFHQYIFNPFEQLDRLQETKSDDDAWWQLVETYQAVVNCPGDIGDPDDPNDDEDPYQLIEVRTYPVPNVYGKINIVDRPDPEYEGYGCTDNRLRYTEEAARVIEYQWYHPPYVTVKGRPGFGQYCLGDPCLPQQFCNYYPLPWGFCCNTIPAYIYGGSTDRARPGAKTGPTPDARYDDDLPPPPGIIIPYN